MDKLEPFMANILKKGIDLDPVEQICKDIFDERLLAFATLAPPDNLNHSINLYDVFTATYKILLTNNTKIICLLFSDKNKIYIEKYKLFHITFFKNYFADNNVIDNVNVIIELQMSDILDDYETMYDVINFVKHGYINIMCTEYMRLYKLTQINDYLLDVISEDNVKYNKSFKLLGVHMQRTEHENTLKELMANSVRRLLHSLDIEISDDFEYSDGCFTIIHDLCKILDFRPYAIFLRENSTFFKYSSEFLKSPLNKYHSKLTSK
jgi:hypothetical protein